MVVATVVSQTGRLAGTGFWRKASLAPAKPKFPL
jgi:hypothetical protein